MTDNLISSVVTVLTAIIGVAIMGSDSTASNSMQQLQQQQTNLLQQLWPYVNGSDIPTGVN